ncbi:hypothetical protein Asppvi_002123 [Aspergillus pseudoviridinutans]|uniref:Uncharacterized protein n=1 Tax=Aspergillus pseudoviridinutans TaxID=1517512 RepID=A0A9P3EQ07_9EURO|nr:uncharacterized protein Asppvi_002123 [Aspergillus pseudoviridinutans]GIJ83304.1 hypothetical protein Asppvi_002123 [Aspergillus pseudoviridinutans]
MEDLALYTPRAIIELSTLSLLFGLMYIILAEPRKKVAPGKCTCQYPDCHYRNPCQPDREVTNPSTLKTESFESGTSHSSPYPNACQKYNGVPKPPPVTDPCIIDYYYHYYYYYYNYHYPNYGQTDSEVTNPPLLTTENYESGTSRSSPYASACQDCNDVPEPPPATDPSIVYYYYYFFSHYYHYHYPKFETDSEVTNPTSSTTESSRHDTSRSRRSRHQKKRRKFSGRIRIPGASSLTAAASSHSLASGKKQMNISRPRASILKSVYMTSWESRIPRPINWDRLHCRSRPKKVTFVETRVNRFYK